MGMYVKAKDGVGIRRGNRVSVPFRNHVDPKTGKPMPSLAKQQFKDECDINVLMKKYEKGLAITHLNRYQGRYEDVSGAVDYREAQNIVLRAQEMFAALPAKVRDRFDNDPAQFMDFALDAKNKDELVKMGLAKLPEPAPAAPVAVPATPGEAVKP